MQRYSAGDTVQDQCGFCAKQQSHEVSIADGDGRIVRVVCDACRSEHRFNGQQAPLVAEAVPRARRGERDSLPLVGERERRFKVMSGGGGAGEDLEMLLRRVIREETGLTPAVPADKWRDGQLVLRPGREGLQEKVWPIESFFHKIVMLRNRLRLLEQQVNGMDELPSAVKIKLQSYITGCYGTLTSFNVLFAEAEDQFHGTGGKD